MKLTAKQAKEKVIYFVDWNSKKVKQGNLYNFVMESGNETTSPRGVMGKVFIDVELYGVCENIETLEQITESEYDKLNDAEQEKYRFFGEVEKYEVREWTHKRYGKGNIIETFNIEEEAKDFLFRRIYESDFTNDDQRDTYYYETELEAITEMELKFRADANYYSS